MPKKEKVFSPGTSSLSHSVGQYVSQGCLLLISSYPGAVCDFARREFCEKVSHIWPEIMGLVNWPRNSCTVKDLSG